MSINAADNDLSLAGGHSLDATLGPASYKPFYEKPLLLSVTKTPGRMGASTRFYLDGVPARNAVVERIPERENIPDIRHRGDVGLYMGSATNWLGGIQGDIAEAIIYNKALSDAERSAVEKHLIEKYGKTIYPANSGFESPNFQNSFAYQPSAPGWTFGRASGIAANGSGFGVVAAPNGNSDGATSSLGQAAFIQGGDGTTAAGSYFSQQLDFQAGSASVTFSIEGRGDQHNPINVKLDDIDLGTYSAASGLSFNTITTPSVSINAGRHTLYFIGTNPGGGDNTEFIDDVSLTNVPAAIERIADGAPGPSTTVPRPIAWFKAENNANDVAASHHGTLEGSASFGTGNVGQAFQFDGKGGCIQIPDSPDWDFGDHDFTIDACVNFTSIQGWNAILAHDEGGGQTNKWIYCYEGNTFALHIQDPAKGGIWLRSIPITLNGNQWYRVAVSRNGNTFSFFADGASIGTATSDPRHPNNQRSADDRLGRGRGLSARSHRRGRNIQSCPECDRVEYLRG